MGACRSVRCVVADTASSVCAMASGPGGIVIRAVRGAMPRPLGSDVRVQRQHVRWRVRGRHVLADAAAFQGDHACGRRNRLGPVRDDHARQLELSNRLVDLAFALDVERARRLVEHDDLRPLVQRTREQHALLLTAGERTAERADQGVVAHRHRHDVLMRGGNASALLDARALGLGVEEGDVVGDRA